MARNGQLSRPSGNAIGVAREVILRATAWRHPQWHQVGSRRILLQRASSALRTRETTGVIVVLEGGDLSRVADLRGPLLLSSSTRLRRTIPGPPDRGRWSGSTTDCAGGCEFHHCLGTGGGAGGAVSSSARRDACHGNGGEFTKSVVCWLVVLSSRRAV